MTYLTYTPQEIAHLKQVDRETVIQLRYDIIEFEAAKLKKV